ncbi:hypothetical protein [Sphaerisporangium sp. NPDC051011]|uniref:hypothetical protein n=1 Tax=Sphaerisporangium sp. NPDC051011 TaxID=3155792 RepID=UPI0033CB8DDA
MSARIVLSCADHPGMTACDDDRSFEGVEMVTAARALLAAIDPQAAAAKVAYVVVHCEVDGCHTYTWVKAAGSITEARIMLSSHNRGWYLARRAGGRVVDGCQWHLGSCCVHHAERLWRGRPCPTLDPAAILPGEAGFPGQATDAQLDLFALGTS